MFKALSFRKSRRTLLSLSSTEDKRAEALLRLEKLRDPRSVATIVDWLICSPRPTPRDFRTAALVLSRLSVRDTLAGIEPYLNDPVRKRRAFEMLGYLGEPAGSLLKPRVAQGDPWAMAAWEAALGPRAVPFFLHLARLSEFGGARCVLRHGSEDDVNTLLKLLLEKESLDNLQPLLKEHLSPATETQRVIRAVFLPPEERGRDDHPAADAFTPEVLELLTAALTSADAAVRKLAATALVTAQPPDAADCLVPLLRDRDRTIRKQAAAVLHQLGWQPASREELLRFCIAASSFEPFIRAGASSVPQLLKVIEQSPAAVADALGRIGDRRAGPALIGLLSSHDAAVRIAAARAVGALGIAEAIPALADAVCRLEPQVAGGMNPEHAKRVSDALLAAIHACLPATPDSDVLSAVEQAEAVHKRLFPDHAANSG